MLNDENKANAQHFEMIVKGLTNSFQNYLLKKGFEQINEMLQLLPPDLKAELLRDNNLKELPKHDSK